MSQVLDWYIRCQQVMRVEGIEHITIIEMNKKQYTNWFGLFVIIHFSDQQHISRYHSTS